VARSKAAVIEVALGLIAERGVMATTVDEISERSGVAKTTIYRHWDSKADVVLDAISTQLAPPPSPDTGTLRGDLQELVTGLAWALTDSPLSPLMPSLIDAAERDPEFAELHRRHAGQRHDVVRGVLRRGVERGELPTDVDLDAAMALLAGPVLYRRLMTRGAVDGDFCRWLVDVVLSGLGAD
jgi:AcrR family transcriptional regulator